MFGIDSLIGVVGNVLDKIFPDANEAAKAKARLMEMNHEEVMACLNADVQIALAQANVNTEEAKSGNLFVAGWRPFIGWVCGIGFAIFIFIPLLVQISALCGVTVAMVTLPTELLMTVMLGMLGLGGFRTFEKVKGVSR